MRTLLVPSFLLVLAAPCFAQAQDAYGRFYRAIRTDDLAGLKQMLEKGDSPNVAGSQKMTPLHDAALIGSAGAMKLLLDHGAQIDVRNSSGFTPLIYAAGSLEKTNLLLDRGAALKVAGGGAPPLEAGKSALMEAASRKGNISVVRALLAKGADIQFADARGLTVLTSASSTGDLDMMSLLLEKGADVNPTLPATCRSRR
jgi:ankyrin repeat protein